MPVKKGSLFGPNGRPLSISSLDSEELQSGEQSPYDIAGLEKEGENLARKAAKRLKKNYASHSESFLEKFIGWHAKKKVDKVKAKLDSLFPRLKNSESTIRTWLASVSERKEQAWSHGSSLLIDMENQIRLYQQHLDFLDEVVNDIRQIDYDILREVTELRIAFAFNQELLNRPSPKPSFVLKTTDRADVVSITVGGGGGSSSDAASSNSINDDINKEQFSEPAVWQAFGTAHGKVVGAQPPAVLNKKPPKTILSSLMGSVSHTHSGTPPPGAMPGEAKVSPRSVPTLTSQRNSFNGRPSKPVLTIDARSVDARSEAVLTGANKSHVPPGRKGSLGGPPGHRSTNSLDGGLENLMWDGESDKRKALSISCVSLQSLKLGIESPVNGGSNSPITTPGSGGSASGKNSTPKGSTLRDLLPASFGRSHSASFTGTGPEMTQIGAGAPVSSTATRGRSGSLNGGARDCSTPPAMGQTKPIPVIPQPATPIARAKTGPSSFSFDHHQHQYSSSDDSTASHSDDDPPTPPDTGVPVVTPKAGGGRKSFSGADSGGVSSDLSKKLSLHKLLLKVDSHEYDLDHLNTTDEDQLEMAKRIKKCLALKETLKSVLSTVQTTQDNETLTLKRMKKLRNELKTVVSTDEILTGSKDEYHTINQALLETGGYYINSNSGSNNNLQALNYSSDDNGGKFRELRAYSNTPPALLVQALHSNNTSLYGIGSGSGSRRNSSPIPMVRQGSESSQSGHHFAPSERIPIPSATRVTPSQSAAVAASGVAAYSFMTTATTGSEAGKAAGEQEEDKLSIRSRSPSIDGEHLNFEEAAIECVDDLKALIQQESEAKAKLAKLTSLIDNANQINQQLMLTTSPSKVK